ncbi:hypothetical protein AgCh_025952 [Apium graveolens]
MKKMIITDYVTLFLLAIVHLNTKRIAWSANRASPVKNFDKFVFDDTGNAVLQSGGSVIWSTSTSNEGVSAMELQDSGNLVLLGSADRIVWQSFDHPANSLLSNQDFSEGMKLVSNPSASDLTYFLEIKSGDVVLYANYRNPQPYWSISRDNRRIIDKVGGNVSVVSLNGNSWRFHGKGKVLLWQFVFSDNADPNSTWVATLGDDGFITFYNLQSGSSNGNSPTRIPTDSCSRPEPCNSYEICYNGNRCQCPSVLDFKDKCGPGVGSSCNEPKGSIELVNAGKGLSYFALGLVLPSSKGHLDSCKSSCLANCSCLAMFHEEKSQNCFHFDTVGSLQGSNNGSDFVSYIKVPGNGGNGRDSGGNRGNKKKVLLVIAILSVTTMVIFGLLYVGIRYYQKQNRFLVESPKEVEEDNFIENISGMPIRFSHRDLQIATNNFTTKLGQGGFGSVYEGVLPDGKQLEGTGQGKKEFRAEVGSIGSIHHLHLVRLKGFCIEGSHRLLVYEYMENGSLERWIFKKNKGDFLDWDTRYEIAIGTAKGLAYLHEDCDVKIVHCDIKPENVLLDDNFLAKVSDFGLAKLMSREQSHVFTTLQGTRGYLAPEWITNYAILEKSDVYSYGMVMLEIIGDDGTRSNEGQLDVKLKIAEDDERVSIAIKVALWCVQYDMHLRPSMTKVVQMLEQVSPVPLPPSSSQQMNSHFYLSSFKSTSENSTSLGPLDLNSCAEFSAVGLLDCRASGRLGCVRVLPDPDRRSVLDPGYLDGGDVATCPGLLKVKAECVRVLSDPDRRNVLDPGYLDGGDVATCPGLLKAIISPPLPYAGLPGWGSRVLIIVPRRLRKRFQGFD